MYTYFLILFFYHNYIPHPPPEHPPPLHIGGGAISDIVLNPPVGLLDGPDLKLKIFALI